MEHYTIDSSNLFDMAQTYRDRLHEWLHQQGISPSWVLELTVHESYVDLALFKFLILEGGIVKDIDFGTEEVRTFTITLSQEDFPHPTLTDVGGLDHLTRRADQIERVGRRLDEALNLLDKQRAINVSTGFNGQVRLSDRVREYLYDARWLLRGEEPRHY